MTNSTSASSAVYYVTSYTGHDGKRRSHTSETHGEAVDAANRFRELGYVQVNTRREYR